MKLNWKVRIKNLAFWLVFVPAVLLVAQVVLRLFGIEFDPSEITGKLIDIVNAVFALLVIVGVVSDPTTPGVQDSDRAMSYETPGKPGNTI